MFKKVTRLTAAAMCLLLLTAITGLSAFAADADKKQWAAAWANGMSDISIQAFEGKVNSDGIKITPFAKNMTVRTRLTPTLDGEKVRFTLSNVSGEQPLTINKASVAYSDESGNAIKGKSLPVTFKGKTSVTIPAGETVTCDPVEMTVRALEDLTVSLYVKDFNRVESVTLYGSATSVLAVGDRVNDKNFNGISLDFNKIRLVPILSELDVYAEGASSIVIMGDSTVSNEIPTLLAKRIISETGRRNIGVVGRGIIGNTLVVEDNGKTGGIYGERTIDRFKREVVDTAGCKYTIVKIGANDIIHPNCKSMTYLKPVTAAELEEGYRSIIRQGHNAGVKVILAEISPWKGYTRDFLHTGDPDVEWNEEYQRQTDEINEWITSQKDSDGVISADCLRDKDDYAKMANGFTDDGVHLSPLAQQAYVGSIDLSLFGIKADNNNSSEKEEDIPNPTAPDEPDITPSEEDKVKIPATGTDILTAICVSALGAASVIIISRKRKVK